MAWNSNCVFSCLTKLFGKKKYMRSKLEILEYTELYPRPSQQVDKLSHVSMALHAIN